MATALPQDCIASVDVYPALPAPTCTPRVPCAVWLIECVLCVCVCAVCVLQSSVRSGPSARCVTIACVMSPGLISVRLMNQCATASRASLAWYAVSSMTMSCRHVSCVFHKIGRKKLKTQRSHIFNSCVCAGVQGEVTCKTRDSKL